MKKLTQLLMVAVILLFSGFSAIVLGQDEETTPCQSLMETIKSTYGRSCAASGYNSIADINKDTYIDVLDYSLAVTNYNSSEWCRSALRNDASPCAASDGRGNGSLYEPVVTQPVFIAKLNSPFGLAPKQEAVIADYNNLRIVLNKIEVRQCFTTPCEPKVSLTVFAPTDHYKTTDFGKEITLLAGQNASLYGAKISVREATEKKATLIVTKEKQEPIYVSLNQDFTLAVSQQAQIVDYNNLIIKLISTSPQICTSDSENGRGLCTQNIPSAKIEISGYAEVTEDGSERKREVALLTLTEGQTASAFGVNVKLNFAQKDKAGFRIEKQGIIYCEDSPTNAECICKTGKKTSLVMESYPVQTRYVCNPEAIYVKLNEKFNLGEKQTAILAESTTLELRLNYIVLQSETNPSDTLSNIKEEISSSPGIQKKRYYANVDIFHSPSRGSSAKYVTEVKNLNIAIGENKELYGLRLSFLEVHNNRGQLTGVFAFEKLESIPDLVDIGIEPREQKAMNGDKVKYEVTIVDKHPQIVCKSGQECPLSYRSYQYSLEVIGLPFASDLPKEIMLGAGEKTKITLVIDTSVAGNSLIIGTQSSVQSTQIQKKCLASGVNYEECQQNPQNRQSIQANIQAKKIGNSGETAISNQQKIEVITRFPYKFAVRINGKDGERSVDVAYATLVVIPLQKDPESPVGLEEIELSLQKGWNLISFPGKAVRTSTSCADLAGFIYLPEEKKYASLKQLENKNILLNDYLSTHAFWAYSPSGCSIKLKIESETSYESMNLASGWNLVSVHKELIGKNIGEITQTCDVQVAYFWNAEDKKWEKINLLDPITEKHLYKGIVIKSNNYCELGRAVVSPPVFPEEQ